MDVWAWVSDAHRALEEEGQHRLAYLLYELPRCTIADQHQRLEALYPEALGLARASGNAWLEIFVRHWYLQSRVLSRMDAGALSEAISLVEFSHRPEHIACPQSVCTTQDLAACYAHADGPAYAPERLELARETLSRLDPKWNCFVCVSIEYADALVDAGRCQEALDFLEQQRRELVRVGTRASQIARFFRNQFRALYLLGRLDEALKVAEDALPVLDDEHQEKIARIFCALVRLEELPPWEQVEGVLSFYEPYAWAAVRQVEAGQLPNDRQLEARLGLFQKHFVQHKVVRLAFEMALRRARLALQRGHFEAARGRLGEAEQLMAGLHLPLDAPEQLQQLRAQLPAPRTLPDDPALLKIPEDPDEAWEWLAPAWEKWPQHESLRKPVINALQRLGQSEQALQVLRDWYAARPGELEPLILLGQTLLGDRQADELLGICEQELAAGPEPERASWCYWLRARAFRQQGNRAACIQDLLSVIELDPEVTQGRLLLARALLEQQQVAEGLEHLLELARRKGDEVGPWDWDIMIHATLLGQWQLVRQHAARLGMEHEGEGEIDDPGETVWLRISEPDGSRRDWLGQRNGPVSALVLECDLPGTPNHLADVVVFEPTVLARDSDQVPTFEVLATLRPGRARLYPLEGIHPGAERLQALRQELRPQVWIRDFSNPDYRLGSDFSEPGFYGLLAVFPEVDLVELHARLEQCTAAWPHRLLWPDLLEAAGLRDERDRHRQQAEQYGIPLD